MRIQCLNMLTWHANVPIGVAVLTSVSLKLLSIVERFFFTSRNPYQPAGDLNLKKNMQENGRSFFHGLLQPTGTEKADWHLVSFHLYFGAISPICKPTIFKAHLHIYIYMLKLGPGKVADSRYPRKAESKL